MPRAALSGSRCLMCPEYEYINLDVGSSGTGELSKALPKSKEQPDLCRSQQDCFSGISRTGECRLQFRVFGNPAAERPAGGGRLDVGQVEGG